MKIKINASRDELQEITSAAITDVMGEVLSATESALDGMDRCGYGYMPVSVGDGTTFHLAGHPVTVKVHCDGV